MKKYKEIKISSILGILGNIFLLIIKLICGVITHSQAMISDAFNSASDIFTSLLTYIGNKIATKEPDEDHNLGHGKAEYLFSLIISIVMMFSTFYLLKSSFLSLFKREYYNFSYFLIFVCIITILVKFFLYLYTIKVAEKHHNLLIKANAIDHRNDCILTTLNLISVIFAYFNIFVIDSLVGIFVSLWIFVVALKLFKESVDILMDKSIDVEGKKQILDIIETSEEVKKINHFNATPVGYRYQISFTIFVDGDMSTTESHEIANRLEKEISKLEQVYLTVIHVNPIEK